MSIRLKMILLVVFTGLAGVASLFVNEVMMMPIQQIEAETMILTELRICLDGYASQVNRLNSESFHDQMDRLLVGKEKLDQAFLKMDEMEKLSSINEAIKTSIENIYQFQESIEKIHQSLLKRSEVVVKTADKLNGSSLPFTVMDLVWSDKLIDSELKKEVKQNIILLDSSTNALNVSIASAITNLETQSNIINNEILRYRERALRTTLFIAIMVLIIPLLIAVIIASLLANRIKLIETGISRMREGDLADRITVNSKDEMGILSKNVNDFTDELGSSMLRIKESSRKNLEIKNELLLSIEKVSEAYNLAEESALTINCDMEKLNARVTSASEAVDIVVEKLDQFENVLNDEILMIENASASVSQMIKSISSVSGITLKKTDEMVDLVSLTSQGSRKLKETNEVISKINGSIEEIGGASQLIAQIAARTNLLAMNATIEAAHAGKSGTGFAVVADEIRKLAEATAANSKRINGVMKDIVKNIKNAVTSGLETDSVFLKVESDVSSARISFEEISSSMEVLSDGGKQILAAMEKLNEFSTTVKGDSNEMRKAASVNQYETDEVFSLSRRAVESVTTIRAVLESMQNEMNSVSNVTRKTDEISETLSKEVSIFKTGAHIA